MNDYYEVRVQLDPCCEDATDLLAGMLADIGYESFVPDASGLTAYVKKELYSAEAVAEAMADFPFDSKATVTAVLVPGQDWNAEWEKNYFKPIVVADRCVIHSTFHSDIPACEYDITVDPKMAFGTGHHSTTALMIERLLSMPLQGKSLADVGTGTGILAILAAMRGAEPVVAIEIDEPAYLNALENARLNGQEQIHFVHGNAADLARFEPFDVLVANINRNIIINDLPRYAAALRPGGTMLLSGFYTADCHMLLEAAMACGLCQEAQFSKPDDWACMVLTK